ncbi:MAG: hypothetical protein F6K36_30160, partial [Symploca sp. SIO3C6]|nr:hypothetical protein [Symploca sp. SIO3C6]
IIRERSYSDSATPSANGIAVANLVRLFLHTETLDYWERANKALKAFKLVLSQAPQACPGLFAALDWCDRPITVKFPNRPSSDRQSSKHQGDMATFAQKSIQSDNYAPTAIFKGVADLPDEAVGLICRSMSCGEPLFNLEALNKQLRVIY